MHDLGAVQGGFVTVVFLVGVVAFASGVAGWVVVPGVDAPLGRPQRVCFATVGPPLVAVAFWLAWPFLTSPPGSGAIGVTPPPPTGAAG